jgi:hypothetical protein
MPLLLLILDVIHKAALALPVFATEIMAAAVI